MIPESMYLTDLHGDNIWVAHDAKKRPFSAPSGRPAKSNDPRTWCDHASAERMVSKRSKFVGVGVQLGPIPSRAGMNLCGVDLDSCFDPERREFAEHAREVINRFDSYCEISQSGKGAKILFLASDETLEQLPQPTGNTQQYAFRGGKHQEMTVSCIARYYSVTKDETGVDPEIFDLLGIKAPLREVSADDLNWFIQSAGPRYQSSFKNVVSNSSTRDNSASAVGFRFFQKCRRLGLNRDQSNSKIEQDRGPAGEWYRRVDQRQRDRAWHRAFPTDPRMAEMDEKHAVVSVGGSVRVANLKSSNGITLSTVGDLHALYSNEFVQSSQGKLISISKAWMASSTRPTYTGGMGFFPGGSIPDDVLNLWPGFAVHPDPRGSCDRFLYHIKNVICGGDENSFNYLIGFLAHLIQHPEDIPGVAIVLRGGKGVGKDSALDYIAKMIGDIFAPVISQPDQLTGRFNGHLQTALLLRVQEALWAGSRKDEGALKSLITSPKITIERKGVDAIVADNYVRVMITANAAWVVPASSDERRFFILEIKAEKPSLEYFKAYHAEMNGSGPAALLHTLQNYDLSGFDVRDVPQTQGLLEQKLLSLRNLDRWWFDFILEGTTPVDFLGDFDRGDWSERPVTLSRLKLRELYRGWVNDHRFHGEPMGVREFGSRLRLLCPKIRDTQPSINGKRVRCYVLPSLGSCRAQFEGWLGAQIDWEEPLP